MGMLAHVAAGALQGLGTSIQNQAIARREEALEAMRQRYKTEESMRAAEARRAERSEDRDFEREKMDTGYKQKAGLLAIGGTIQQQRDQAQHGYKVEEIKQTQVGAQELARLNSRLDQARTAAEIKLRDQLSSGDISNVVRGQDGQYYGVTDKGLVPTGVAAPPTDATETGGGRLTESEQEAAYNDDRRAWREGGKKGPEPKKSDYIGMTRQSYKGRGDAAAPAAQPTSTRMSDYQMAVSQLATSYADATPERYPGLFRDGKKIPLEEARRILEQRYR